MVAYSLSSKAAADLDGIYEYTILNFGFKKAQTYLLGLQECFQVLSENPKLGRSAEQLAPELRRYEHQSHVIFYMPKRKGVLIVRVLHESMNAPRHL
jgi:toxin ParE1/3/4